jgi:tetratricopeptide (TPR) repeat protein
MARTLPELEEAHERGTNPLVYIPLAEELRKRRQYQRALQICRQGLDRHGASVRGYTILGKILLDMRHFEAAVDALRRAVELAPGSYEPTLLLTKALTQRCEFLEAREALAPLLASHARDNDVRQLARVIEAELSESATAMTPRPARPAAAKRGAKADGATSELRQQLEDLEGVDVVFEFGVRAVRGDVFFEEIEGQELDEDIKVTVIEGWRLASKLNFGKPTQFIIEAPGGKIFLRIQGGRGLMALTSANVKLGRLRYMMDQCLRVAAGNSN